MQKIYTVPLDSTWADGNTIKKDDFRSLTKESFNHIIDKLNTQCPIYGKVGVSGNSYEISIRDIAFTIRKVHFSHDTAYITIETATTMVGKDLTEEMLNRMKLSPIFTAKGGDAYPLYFNLVEYSDWLYRSPQIHFSEL